MDGEGDWSSNSRVTASVYCFKAVVRSCSIKKVLQKISQTPQEKACARVSFLIKIISFLIKIIIRHFNKNQTLVQVLFCKFC